MTNPEGRAHRGMSLPILTIIVLYVLTLVAFSISVAVLIWAKRHTIKPRQPTPEELRTSDLGLPRLSPGSRYLSHLRLQKYNVTNKTLIVYPDYDNRPVIMYRESEAFNPYVAYEFYSNNVPVIGAIQSPRYVDERHTAVLVSGGGNWEHWVIKDGGETIEKVILAQDRDGVPSASIGVYERI